MDAQKTIGYVAFQIGQPPKRPYKHIPNRKRQILIQKFLSGDNSLKELSNELDINYSTCKTILANYRKTGRLCKKVTRTQRSSLQNSRKTTSPKKTKYIENNSDILLGKRIERECNIKDKILPSGAAQMEIQQPYCELQGTNCWSTNDELSTALQV